MWHLSGSHLWVILKSSGRHQPVARQASGNCHWVNKKPSCVRLQIFAKPMWLSNFWVLFLVFIIAYEVWSSIQCIEYVSYFQCTARFWYDKMVLWYALCKISAISYWNFLWLLILQDKEDRIQNSTRKYFFGSISKVYNLLPMLYLGFKFDTVAIKSSYNGCCNFWSWCPQSQWEF